MAKNKKANNNFRLGLNRKELIEASQLFGKKLSTAKKDSTKRLEQYITTQLGGRGTKVPQFTDRQKDDIRNATKDFGLQDSLHMVSYRIGRLTGNQDENNYLRLTVGRAFNAYYDGQVTSNILDELLSRIGDGDKNELISGISNHNYHYQQIFMDYSEELENKDNNK